MISKIRTDLAFEAHEVCREEAGELAGVKASHSQLGSFGVTTVEVLDERGEQSLGKPKGKYVTVELDGFVRREENAFASAVSLISQQLREFLPQDNNACVLVAGLGNRAITPDAIGPVAVDNLMVTRHLRAQLPEHFGAFRPVAAVCSGVLGTTGIESGDLVSSVTETLHPAAVVAIDALVSRDPTRLCRTVQIADTGIVPGSGVGNARQALSRDTLGVPVIAVGVPTVVDSATLALDLAGKSGTQLDPSSFGDSGKMIVTSRDIDKTMRDAAKLVAYSLNMALHKGVTMGDIDMFLS